MIGTLLRTQSRGRTGTGVTPLVFETNASTDSAIWANSAAKVLLFVGKRKSLAQKRRFFYIFFVLPCRFGAFFVLLPLIMTPTNQSLFQRTQMLLGDEAMRRLSESRVAVFGVGGVGGYAVEVLARSGVGAIDLFDNDTVALSNINRQVIALTTNVGRLNVDVAAERIAAINPDCRVTPHAMFYLPANADEVDLTQYDYVIDCIDTVAAKMELIRRCTSLQVPLICSMGAAYKLDPTAWRVGDITHTINDPLARTLRKRLRREGIRHFLCVYSTELPRQVEQPEVEPGQKRPPASNAWVPAAAGLVLGGEVVRRLALPE